MNKMVAVQFKQVKVQLLAIKFAIIISKNHFP